ncbi:SRPBCC family protein [Streptomyces sp. TRM66268-LWL]|uniref:SRPBCC family protein n=1 Tax=Streptomyces polyasparticus TaxID=2767826 RepID=A0ABR7SKL5_9ACTN|nr:SRPBCC family protein [Streptomyces polyasparticus]MBC9715972.1 SRPBCC family protein [Streptomyces polyasparticus]
MARRLSPVGLDFLEVAPVRLVFAREISASPAEAYHAIAEEVETMPKWFRSVKRATPHDGGARRTVVLGVGIRFEETILAKKPDEIYAYRVDETNAPGVRNLVEEWRITPAGSGSRIQWTFSVDGAAPLRAFFKIAGPGLGAAFRGAVSSLDKMLAKARAQQ